MCITTILKRILRTSNRIIPDFLRFWKFDSRNVAGPVNFGNLRAVARNHFQFGNTFQQIC